MGIWTQAELEEQIALWKEAFKQASTGKSYSINGRTLTRYDLAEIRTQLDYFKAELSRLERGKGSLVAVKARRVR